MLRWMTTMTVKKRPLRPRTPPSTRWRTSRSGCSRSVRKRTRESQRRTGEKPRPGRSPRPRRSRPRWTPICCAVSGAGWQFPGRDRAVAVNKRGKRQASAGHKTGKRRPAAVNKREKRQELNGAFALRRLSEPERQRRAGAALRWLRLGQSAEHTPLFGSCRLLEPQNRDAVLFVHRPELHRHGLDGTGNVYGLEHALDVEQDVFEKAVFVGLLELLVEVGQFVQMPKGSGLHVGGKFGDFGCRAGSPASLSFDSF